MSARRIVAVAMACATLLTGSLAGAPALLPQSAIAAEVPDFSEMVKRVRPAVVTVQVEATARTAQLPGLPLDDPALREFLKRFFGDLPPMPPPGEGPKVRGLGSGFIIDPKGIIVTNNHVVAEADTITVVLDNGDEFDARLLGRDEKADLAVLKIDAGRDLPFVEWGDSDKFEVGDWAIAIGNPFGIGITVTAGIVSARGRDLHSGPYDDFIQVDAPINRGNSGGPLFNQDGEVVGVNTAIFSPTGGNIGIGFSIPSNQARAVVKELIEKGHVVRGWIGVTIQPVNRDIADSLGLDRPRGALVAKVEPGGPAARAGIRTGDVILKFGDREVRRLRDLTRAVADTDPGTKTTVEVWRNGEVRRLTIATGKMPEEEGAAVAAGGGAGAASASALDELGIRVRPSDEGLVVTAVDPRSDAAEKGIRPGDVIVTANQEELRSVADLERVVREAKKKGRRSVLLLVGRGGVQRFVTVRIGEG